MPVIYLTFDSAIELEPVDDVTKGFKGKLGIDNWTITDFLFEKFEFKIYHNEFLSGAHFVDGELTRKYIIRGTVKMTVKAKAAEALLAECTEWKVIEVRVRLEDDNFTQLLFLPTSPNSFVLVRATLDKPSN